MYQLEFGRELLGLSGSLETPVCHAGGHLYELQENLSCTRQKVCTEWSSAILIALLYAVATAGP